MSDETISDGLQKVFAALDTDNNGLIDVGELHEAFKQGGFDCAEKVLKRMMNYLGAPDGVNPRQFAELSKLLNDFKVAFNEADSDKNGAIDHVELGRALIDLGYSLKPGEVKLLIDAVDADKNGTVEFAEFVDLSFYLLIAEKAKKEAAQKN
jgi:Ca2+-binding EF-hand superfamily protein